MPPGTRVQVAKEGQWYGATIVQPLGEGRFLVHYDNTGDQWNEPVGPERIRALGAGGTADGPARDYHPGEKVLVTFQNRLLLGEVVMAVGADLWRIHYDGFGPEAAENVGPARLKRPFGGQSGHKPGESLVVEVNGQALAAKVLAASAADRWVVRFETYGPEYDQEVGVDRIKAAGVAPPVEKPAVAPPVEKPAVALPVEKPAEKPPEKVVAKPAEKPKAPPGEAAPAVPPGPPSVGENVLINVRGAWFAASVTAVMTGSAKVKFAAGGEEEISAERILREPGPIKGLRYQVGQLVLIDYKGVFVPGKVLKQEGKGEYKIRFEGQGPEADEVIAVKRLRPR